MFIAPITGKSPEKGRIVLEIPETEARRAGLDAVVPLWVMVDELNAATYSAANHCRSRNDWWWITIYINECDARICLD